MSPNNCAAHFYTRGNNPLIIQDRSSGIFADNAAGSAWETRRCMNPGWCGGTWVVEQDPTYADLWRVARHPNDSAVIIEAAEPMCPRCRNSLAAMLELPNQAEMETVSLSR